MVSLVEREETCPLTTAALIGVLNFLKPCFRSSGGIGIRGGLKHHWATMWVRVPP